MSRYLFGGADTIDRRKPKVESEPQFDLVWRCDRAAANGTLTVDLLREITEAYVEARIEVERLRREVQQLSAMPLVRP